MPSNTKHNFFYLLLTLPPLSIETKCRDPKIKKIDDTQKLQGETKIDQYISQRVSNKNNKDEDNTRASQNFFNILVT